MAQLPPDGQFLIQQIDGIVVIFDKYSQEEFHRFDPSDANTIGITVGKIFHDERLTEEQRCFAVFWSGYFYAHAH